MGELLHGRFEVLGSLGEGAFGRVLRCFDRTQRRPVALKQLHRFGPEPLLRFKKEFRAFADVRHPNLVRLGELLEDESGRWAFTMEIVEGCDFLAWVRPSPDERGFDEARLRSAFSELVDGLDALHRLGMLHRDIKPSNIRVTPEGRVVLLDFGLVTHLEAGAQSTEAGGVGTAAYMAPEQARGEIIGPAADLYAAGVVLYEALTGDLPFVGSPVSVLMQKQTRAPRAPAGSCANVPGDLSAVCMRLLSVDPHARVLGDSAQSGLAFVTEAKSGLTEVLPPSREPFFGRCAELGHLHTLFCDARDQGLRIALIEGESGIGKTALMEHFLASVGEREPSVMVLSGRCHAAEHLRFKTLDGVMDGLARKLSKLSRAACAALMPDAADLLPALFPVLSRVKALPKPRARSGERDRVAERQEGFQAVGLLLDRLASTQPVVVAIDDLQWGDIDSLVLLEVVLSSRRPPRVLIVATSRPLEGLEGEYGERLRRWAERTEVSRMVLGPLSSEHAIALGASILGVAETDPRAKRVADAAAGHPWFLTELVKQSCSVGSDQDRVTALDLDAALRTRAQGLPLAPRSIMELLSAGGGPQPISVLQRALSIDAGELERALDPLWQNKLIREPRRGELACYHDRVREAVAAGLSTPVQRALHARLAEAWEIQGNSERVARHWQAADEPGRARPWLIQAATAASEAGAYAQAASLFADALREDLRLPDAQRLTREERHALELEWADALAFAGRSAESARVLLQAIDTGSVDSRVNLECRAAEQLLRAGELVAGVDAAQRVFATMNIAWPKTRGRAVLRMVATRAWLGLRGVAAKRRPSSEITAAEQAELDSMWRISQPLGWADLLRGAELSARHLRRSLAVGDVTHVGQALCLEAHMQAVQDPLSGKAQALLARAKAILGSQRTREHDALLAWAEGVVALTEGDYRAACEDLERAERSYREDCPREAWRLATARSPLLSNWFVLGRHALHAEKASQWIQEAELRGDAFARATYVVAGLGCHRHLVAGQPERTLDEVEDAMKPLRSEGFGLQHFLELVAVDAAHRYRGGSAAREFWNASWPKLERSLLLRVGFVRELASAVRADASMFAAAKTWSRSDPISAEARRLALGLKQPRTAPMAGLVALLRAQVRVLDGEHEEARRDASAAKEHCARAGFYAERIADLLLAYLDGPDRARQVEAQILRGLRAEGWVVPERGIALNLPVYDELRARWR